MSGELDEFRLVRPLGRGGMGEVYLGHDTVLDRAVAIKLIGARNPDATSRERFLIEARAIARLSHPNVVTIYRVGATGDGRPFLVQELIRGKSLDQLPRPMPWREVCELAIGIARGLEAAHLRGILHRDVKPANVMLDEHGVARLLDFGLAKLSGGGELRAAGAPPTMRERHAVSATGSSPAAAVSPGEDDARELPVTAPRAPRCAPGAEIDGVAETRDLAPLGTDSTAPGGAAAAATLREPVPRPTPEPTVAGAVLGTPRYMAPELWRGEPASVRSDLYSLGAMLYELLTGSAPYPQDHLDELRRAILDGSLPSVPERAPDVQPALGQLVMRCLARDPRDRPASAASVAHELAAIVVDAPAVPEGNPYRGLRRFDAAHSSLFFGRGADVDAIVDRLRTEPLIAVVGDSGIGKSSVCHAGVAPAVAAGRLADRRSWRAVSLVPGRTPWAALCDALAVTPAGDDPVDQLVRALRPDDDAGVLIVIDQLEELVTLAAPGEAARVAEAIAAIAAAGAPGVRLLLAVRGDFLTRVAALPELGGPMTRGLHLLRALSAADLREAVVGPARATGVRFETDAMVDELVAAVAGTPGALPLLQFTLAELWQARDAERAVIPVAALAALGGVGGGLAGHADAVLLGLGAPARAAARRIVLRLVSDARTRAVRERSELCGDDDLAAAALESLVRGRLVVARDTTEGVASYELAHEALIGSWGTLRDWLDEEAGQLAARNRLQASASEWQRLARPLDLLWTRRQLDEVHALDELTANERAFVDASRRRLRRRQLSRIAAFAAVPLLALVITVVWLVTVRGRDRAFAALVDAASTHEARASGLVGEVRAARDDAFRRFDADDDARGEARWAEARQLSAGVHKEYASAVSQLEAAFEIDSAAAQPRLAGTLWAEAEAAELDRDDETVATLLGRLKLYEPERAASWQQPGRIVLTLDRPARISLHVFRCFRRPADCVPGGGGPTISGGFDEAPVIVREAAQLDEELAPGSYVALITTSDDQIVRAPFVIARGERVAQSVTLPARAASPAGFVYIPEGDFFYGSNRDEPVRRSLEAHPMHRVHGAAFWISRTEVTFEQWIAYLRALPPAERKQALPSGAGVKLEEQGGRFELQIEPSPHEMHRAVEGEPLVYPGRKVRSTVRWERLPVSGVSYHRALPYTAWLHRSGRVPGARICTAREWEHAARGADGRLFPHGNVLRPDEANIDETYGRTSSAYGPDEVGSFPASNSPYDVVDLAGNVWELTIVGKDRPWFQGGCFYHPAWAATSENRGNPAEPNLGNLHTGLRICADAAPAR